MKLQIPEFWYKRNIISILLWPFALIYTAVSVIRGVFVKPYKSKIPVICVGNVTVGGAGKTPVASALALNYIAQGKKPVFLSRGYGGNIKSATLVNPDIHKSSDVGDEPLLLAAIAPVVVCSDRKKGLELAEKQDANIVIMDDGLQNPTIFKDESILVIDGSFGLGNNMVMPSGPLRESLKSALRKCSKVIIVGEDKTGIAAKLPSYINAKIIPQFPAEIKDKAIIAFAGIGNPAKFFNMLREYGYNVVEAMPYPDHYQYNEQDLSALRQKAVELNSVLVTTEKDLVRIDNKEGIFVVPVKVKLE